MKLARLTFALISLVLFSSLITLAGNKPKFNRKVAVEISVATTRNGIPELNQRLLNDFKKALVANGFAVSEDGEFRFFLDAKKVSGDNQNTVAISVVAQHALPEKLIQYCAEKELFYRLWEDSVRQKFPKEGKFIREYMTSEMLRQYGMLSFHDLIITRESRLDSVCVDIVERFVERNRFLFLSQK